jgi:hypothetical protein
MHGGKALLLILVVGLLVATGVFIFIPSVRPAFVQDWFNKAQGYTAAKTAEEALDKFKQAMEKRDYQAASLYLGGDYKEFFDKGRKDAQDVATSLDDLRHAMKTTGIKSDRSQFVLFLVDPFPPDFKYRTSGTGDSVSAVLDWSEALVSHRDTISRWGGETWPIDHHFFNSLLPMALLPPTPPQIQVTVKKEGDGAWRIHFPVETGSSLNSRHMRETAEYLRKHGSNYKNAFTGLKNDVKNNPTTKENFERDLRTKLEESKAK